MNIEKTKLVALIVFATAVLFSTIPVLAQLIDKTKAPNIAKEGINKSLVQQIGAGRGDRLTPDSSSFIIARDPFRSVRRGRQLFQRKFTRAEGQGPVMNDGSGDVNSNLAIGAGLSDSCASCHGRPRGGGGAGGDVATRPDSRDAPHLFGLGLKEMLADEITGELRSIKGKAISEAAAQHRPVTRELSSKGIDYGTITANPDGSINTAGVVGIDSDLRVRPFFHHGGTISIREFVVGALNAEMGLQAVDPDLTAASAGARITTPAGMVLDGSLDAVEAPPASSQSDDPDGDGKVNEIPVSLVDHLEFYLLNYFKPATYEETESTRKGRRLFERIGCAQCHIPDLQLDRDRRVADVETVYDPVKGIFNNLFATAIPLIADMDDGSGFPTLKRPRLQPFLVRNIFADFKRHDLGPSFYERNYDGTTRTQFITTPLWGVGSTGPYGHDGRSINLTEVILRHGGEAEAVRSRFDRLGREDRSSLLDFLNSLIIYPPDDTASNLDPGNRNAIGFPQFGHGSIRLTTLFNNPGDLE
ncbi:MAG TPA: di-heme oxidoredictase family protein [Blastocatellia bacterium]|nr:di-heme oxidoredictase family protein [Blastocatellia bacterium]